MKKLLMIVLAMVLLISGDGVDAIRVEGFGEKTEAEAIREYYEELETLGHSFAYTRVARSLDGTQMEMFQEWDLDFSSLSYQTAVPEIFGDNVEDMMMDNGDGTWLRRVDGEGFSAVYLRRGRPEREPDQLYDSEPGSGGPPGRTAGRPVL